MLRLPTLPDRFVAPCLPSKTVPRRVIPEITWRSPPDARGFHISRQLRMPSVATLTRALAKKADIAEFNAMLKTARERVRKLFNEGKSEADVIAVRPLKDLDAKWVASHEAAVATKMVYNSFKRSSPLVRRESRIQQPGRQAAEVIEGEDVAVAGRESEAWRSDHHQRT